MSKKYIVHQNDIKDCGICCLESIIKYYNGFIPLETLRLDTRTNQNGTTAYNLIKTAQKYGFSAVGRKDLSLESKELLLPAIAHTITKKGINHFVVIYKCTPKYVYVMDPAKGYTKLTKEEFRSTWTNIILIFKPFKKIPLYPIKNNLKDLFIKIIVQEKELMKKIILCNIIMTILSIIIGYYFKVIVTSVEKNYLHTTYFLILMFLGIHILKIYFTHLRNEVSIYLNKNIDLSIVPGFISHILNLPLNVINSRTSGEILTRVRELYNLKELFSEIFITIILDLFLGLGSAYFLYYISKELFFILCIIALLYCIVGYLTNPIIQKNINDNIDLETDFNSILCEEISSIETTKNLNLVDKKIDTITRSYTHFQENTFHYLKQVNGIETIKRVINDIGLFLITSYGIYLISLNKLNIIALITFNTLLSYFIDPIENSINLLPKWSLIKLSIHKISEFLNLTPEKAGKIEPFSNGDILFKGITYAYDNYTKILQNVTLKIKKNDHIILKGHTGSGKSTLMKMLNLNIDDYQGTITIDGINVKDYSKRTLRKNILYISQREKIYTDTILNNLTLSEKINKKELNEVLKITKVNEIIDKKALRLESILYDGGYNLSGGERQRIILARSLLRKPSILIMDESLSEVDKKTELEILKNLDIYCKETTIIYISHTNTQYFKTIVEMETINDRKRNSP